MTSPIFDLAIFLVVASGSFWTAELSDHLLRCLLALDWSCWTLWPSWFPYDLRVAPILTHWRSWWRSPPLCYTPSYRNVQLVSALCSAGYYWSGWKSPMLWLHTPTKAWLVLYMQLIWPAHYMPRLGRIRPRTRWAFLQTSVMWSLHVRVLLKCTSRYRWDSTVSNCCPQNS